ncbi:ATP-binding protein [Gallaecimonas sp. GXIMD1310]|uniref:ATP-binding protein n=1 Tax=Gallaecimonas sp. GXIMD1310 TaxID=3131926 RepID=UPI0032465001
MTLPTKADFTPTKRFFVEMLTRDIDLEDAILDLLDNCLDGVARKQNKNPDEVDYKGYWVKINFDKNQFIISDNCGGIPTSSVDYAFRMGRPSNAPKENLATVGVYGIGMKRSIFKIGKHCVVNTKHSDDDSFQVVIDEEWLKSDLNWEVDLQRTLSLDSRTGTTIEITKIIPAVSNKFGNKSFVTSVINKVIYAYSYIISKGFSVEINGEKINPNPIKIRYEIDHESGSAIQPYMYKARIDDVDVSLVVGLNAPLVTEKEEEEEKKAPKNRTENAGWTIVCNDRIVVYRDKSELTGWGVDFSRYHTQYIAISGIVYFKSTNPESLPITTTKRGIDVTSPLFLKVRKHIIEGTKIFIDYTNKWKGEELIKESNARLNKSEHATPLEVIDKFESEVASSWTKVKNRSNELKYKPKLPVPSNPELKTKKITFRKDEDKIEFVACYLGLDEGCTPNQVGEECFEFVFKEGAK